VTADLYIFPLARRIGYIREKASKLLNRRDRADADRYLDEMVIGCSHDSLARFGRFPAAEIERELDSLRSAVIAESWRQVMTRGRVDTERA
jgi:hypothetical protein